MRIFGKRIKVPRRQGLFSKDAVSYKFGSTTINSLDVSKHAFLKALLQDVSETHNAIFVNWYQNGKDYIDAHSNDEQGMTKDGSIVSLSLGAERTFRIAFKDKRAFSSGSSKMDFILGNGDLFVMGGNFKTEFLHEVPKKVLTIGDARRISLTIRSFLLDDYGGHDRKRKRDMH
eukprot:gene336-614_t